MSKTRTTTIAIAGLLICLGGVFSSNSQRGNAQEAASKAKLERAIDAARATLEAADNSYRIGTTNAEDIYRWSARLMQAERKANPNNRQAVLDHVARMRTLHDVVAEKYKIGAKGGSAEEYYAARYYLAEAEAEQ